MAWCLMSELIMRASLMATPISTISVLRFLLFVSLLLSKDRVFAFGERLDSGIHHHSIDINSLLPSSVCSPSPKAYDEKRVSLEVVHRHGPCSNLSHTSYSHEEILSQDESRVASIQSRLAGRRNNIKDSKTTIPAKSGIALGTGNYVVRVGIGSPRKDLSVVFDTGSDLSWTQCQPCVRSCYNQHDQIFDPRESRSYANISCSSPQCQLLASATGNDPGCTKTTSICVYGVQYGDGSFSIGFFAKDKLTLGPADTFDDFQFGCGQNNQGLFGKAAGLLGLGRDPLSLPSQTAKKYGKVFSYCLPSSGSSTGYLTFGREDAFREVKYTPSKINTNFPSFYFLGMEGISVDGRKLEIPTSVFSTADTIIDSGTVISRLPPKAYSVLQKAFAEEMGKLNYKRVDGVSILDTCYDLSEHKVGHVPKIALYFNGSVEMDLIPEGILYTVKPSQVCLAFAGNSDDADVGLIGNVQQKAFHVVYDDAVGRVGFAPRGCN